MLKTLVSVNREGRGYLIWGPAHIYNWSRRNPSPGISAGLLHPVLWPGARDVRPDPLSPKRGPGGGVFQRLDDAGHQGFSGLWESVGEGMFFVCIYFVIYVYTVCVFKRLLLFMFLSLKVEFKDFLWCLCSPSMCCIHDCDGVITTRKSPLCKKKSRIEWAVDGLNHNPG